MKKAILISGAFNPITNAHVEMGRLLHEKYPEYDIIYSVTSDEYLEGSWKGANCYLSSATRTALVKQSVDSQYCKVIEECQLYRKLESTWTYDICNYLCDNTANTPYEELIVCVGADKLKALHKWYKADKLLSSYNFVVFNRYHRCKFPQSLSQYEHKFTQLTLPEEYQDISSTQVRNAWFSNTLDSVHNVIPLPVYNFLNTDRLFNSLKFPDDNLKMKYCLTNIEDEVNKLSADKQYRVELCHVCNCLLLHSNILPTDMHTFYEWENHGVELSYEFEETAVTMNVFLNVHNEVKVRYTVLVKDTTPDIESLPIILRAHNGGILDVTKV